MMMKKLISLLLTAALLLGCASAFAEEQADAAIRCEIVDGSYVIRMPVAEGDTGWKADDMAQDDTVVKLGSAEIVDGVYVVRYDPTGDGEVTVRLRHFNGIACDDMHTWDLRVANGAVQENFAGSHTMSPAEEEQDSLLSGEWLEKDTQFTQMTVEKNPERGWDVEVASPMTHGAYIFRATVYFDCELDAFIYDGGAFWEVPITDSDEEVELGDPAVSGTSGSFTIQAGENEEVFLLWYDTSLPEEETVFARAAE